MATKRIRCRRRAATYMLILGSAMLLAVIGYASIINARFSTRTVTRTNDWAEAGVLANSAVESAIAALQATADWRTSFVSGEKSSGWSLGRGQASVVLVDEQDGDLADGSADSARLYGIGHVGDAVRVRSVQLVPRSDTPLSCLEVSVYSDDELSIVTAALTSDQIVGTGDRVTGVFGELNGDIEALLASSGLGFDIDGTETIGVPPRDLPDPDSVFESYVANGTAIPVSALLDIDGVPTIDRSVLTPTYNSITGEVNAQGIYVVDCQGQTVNVQNSRIQGTLVLLNAQDSYGDPNCEVTESVNWEPALPNYPALLVDGDLSLKFKGGVALEETSVYANFNPVAAPYNGEEDSLIDDSYPSHIKGLVYARACVVFRYNTPIVDGVVVAGTNVLADSGTDATITYDNAAYLDPPPGFGTGMLEPVAGTWRWNTLP